jgi:hypothetical protein
MAISTDGWYDMNGRSPTSSAFAAPLATARAWWTTSSSVTGMVVGWPSITMPRLSPTRRTGISAWSARSAVV